MKLGMIIEYPMCRADLNFEVDFGILLYSDAASFSSIIFFFFYKIRCIPLQLTKIPSNMQIVIARLHSFKLANEIISKHTSAVVTPSGGVISESRSFIGNTKYSLE